MLRASDGVHTPRHPLVAVPAASAAERVHAVPTIERFNELNSFAHTVLQGAVGRAPKLPRTQKYRRLGRFGPCP